MVQILLMLEVLFTQDSKVEDLFCADEWQHRKMVQNNSRSKSRMSSVTNPLQHFSRFWLVGCFGFNDPLRQYFSLYRAVSQREG